jgi:bifunctional non-homologous end joining protein LigD
MARPRSTLHVAGHDLEVSSLDKVLYPETGFTKGDVIRYYIDVAPVLLPHLEDRALTMKRYPDGVGKFFFYEKNCPPHRPKWLRTTRVPSTQKDKDDTRYCVVDTLPGLVWAANLADLELHVSLARAGARQRPTVMVFDLDPGPGTGLVECSRIALELRDRFARGKLKCFPKTSGSKGLQVYVPLNTPRIDFDRTKDVAREVAEALAADFPDEIVANMRKELRKGKVFIDWSQNDDHKTTVCVYSLRATPQPQVSTPLQWKEVETALRKKDPDLLRFGPDDISKRIKKYGDLFEPVLKLKQAI